MSNRRSRHALLLFAILVLGGIGAPTLHGVQDAVRWGHAAERLRQEERAADGGDTSSGFVTEEVAASHDLFCHLCLHFFAGTSLQAPVVAAYLRQTPLLLPAVAGRLLPVAARHPIRGPPAFA